MKNKNVVKVFTNNSFCNVEIKINGKIENVSKDTAILKINRIIEDLKDLTDILDRNKNIDFKNTSFGGVNNYDWDYIANK